MKQYRRQAGVLLHPTSLPSPYGIGDLGHTAYHFVDFLEAAGQKLWQILPLTHTGFGDSPYQSFSAFAGQPLLISPDHLKELGLLFDHELKDAPAGDSAQVDYGTVIPWKHSIFRLAYNRFYERDGGDPLKQDFARFCQEEAFWLEDYALFLACKDANDGRSWLDWPDMYRSPSPEYKEELKQLLQKEAGYYKFLQFIFFTEWGRLKAYANEKGIQIIGDIPIFVSMDSADVWANKELFHLDEKGYPLSVAGVPPDYFSATGQLWGNPLYAWDAHKNSDFSWWISRIRTQLKNLDILRIDHFRGFDACWSIPYGEPTAVNGHWAKVPGWDLFDAISQALGDDLPIIAEDLGIITDEVNALREHFGFPGMKVLQFAFDSTDENAYLPHRFESPVCVCYTGTHDNATTLSWYKTLPEHCRKKVCAYTGTTDEKKIGYGLIKAALSSIATYAIYPLQDLLFCGDEGRMNTPGKATGNWSWRFRAQDLKPEYADTLRELTLLYGHFD